MGVTGVHDTVLTQVHGPLIPTGSLGLKSSRDTKLDNQIQMDERREERKSKWLMDLKEEFIEMAQKRWQKEWEEFEAKEQKIWDKRQQEFEARMQKRREEDQKRREEDQTSRQRLDRVFRSFDSRPKVPTSCDCVMATTGMTKHFCTWSPGSSRG